MLKKLCTMLIAFAILMCFTLPAFAARSFDKDVKTTEQTIVKLSRPNGNESTYKKTFLICGNTSETGVIVELYKLDSETGLYKPFEDEDGDSSWKIGSFGSFSAQVKLNSGENKFLIAAYKSSDANNQQITKFQIKMDESLKDFIENGLSDIGDALKGLFK